MNNLVSVIITTYKREIDILFAAIDSVVSQTYKEIEIIVIDDNGIGSEYQKNNSKVVDKYSNIKYYANKNNSGVQFSRNLGILISNGTYVAFLDDDDLWMPQKIEKQILMMNNQRIGMVFCGGYNFYDNDIEKKDLYYNHIYLEKKISFEELLNEGDYIGSTSQALIKKECFAKCGMFDCSLKSRQDYEMWLRISRDYEIVSVPEPLFYYREHCDERVSKSNTNLLNGYYGLLSKYRIDYRKFRKGRISIWLKIANLYKETNVLKAFFIYAYCFFNKPIFTIKKTFLKIKKGNWNSK